MDVSERFEADAFLSSQLPSRWMSSKAATARSFHRRRAPEVIVLTDQTVVVSSSQANGKRKGSASPPSWSARCSGMHFQRRP